MDIPWGIPDSTKVKHNILENYIKAWASILYNNQKKNGFRQELIYFDGFCGPGKYYADESKTNIVDGSPIIVGKIANELINNDNQKKFIIVCTDEKKECINILENDLKILNKHNQNWITYKSNFNDAIHEFIDMIDKKEIRINPIFYFIDPFGYSGIPLSTLKKLLQYQQTEIFLNFMVYDINRASSDPSKYKSLFNLFGCDDFKEVNKMQTPEERQGYLKNLYIEQLKKIAKVEYVTPFRVNTPNQKTRPRFYLIHCTNHIVAMKTMKDAMFKISDKDYGLEAINVEKNLFTFFEHIDFENEILEFLKNNSNITIEYDEIEKWCYINTCGVSKTIKKALMSLEKKNKIEIIRLPKQKLNTVTNGAKIKAC